MLDNIIKTIKSWFVKKVVVTKEVEIKEDTLDTSTQSFSPIVEEAKFDEIKNDGDKEDHCSNSNGGCCGSCHKNDIKEDNVDDTFHDVLLDKVVINAKTLEQQLLDDLNDATNNNRYKTHLKLIKTIKLFDDKFVTFLDDNIDPKVKNRETVLSSDADIYCQFERTNDMVQIPLYAKLVMKQSITKTYGKSFKVSLEIYSLNENIIHDIISETTDDKFDIILDVAEKSVTTDGEVSVNGNVLTKVVVNVSNYSTIVKISNKEEK